MYIPEFWCGVLATMGIEFIICATLIGIAMWRNKNEDSIHKGNK